MIDLKLAKQAPKTSQSRDALGAISVAPGDQIQRIGGSFQGRFASFRSSPIRPYWKGVHTVMRKMMHRNTHHFEQITP